jgi:phage baseplate assembly protein gpV
MQQVKNFVTNIIKRCFITKAGADNQQFPVSQISYLEKTSDCEIVMPYGLYGNPPANSMGILFHPFGEEQNRMGIFNVTGSRFKNLKEGEVVAGNPLTLSNIKFDKDGNVTITVKNNLQITVDVDNNITISGSYNLNAATDATIESPIINLVGNVVVSGTLTANGGAITMTGGNFNTSGDVIAQGTSLHTHVHGGVTPGGSNTGAPV